MSGNKMSENKHDYEVGRDKPPVHTRFKKGPSGNPRGPRPKNLPALLVEALNEKVVVTIDGERREITKREAVATQLVNKSTGADLRATKMLIDTLNRHDLLVRRGKPGGLGRLCALPSQLMNWHIEIIGDPRKGPQGPAVRGDGSARRQDPPAHHAAASRSAILAKLSSLSRLDKEGLSCALYLPPKPSSASPRFSMPRSASQS